MKALSKRRGVLRQFKAEAEGGPLIVLGSNDPQNHTGPDEVVRVSSCELVDRSSLALRICLGQLEQVALNDQPNHQTGV